MQIALCIIARAKKIIEKSEEIEMQRSVDGRCRYLWMAVTDIAIQKILNVFRPD
jgi:hypothetical protein